MKEPDWFRIVRDSGFTNGPTIPFLVGALRSDPELAVEDDTSKRELAALIWAMRDEMPSGQGVCIEWCHPLLDAHVVGLRSGGGLQWQDMHPDFVSDADTLVEALWDRYGAEISARRFSRERANPATGSPPYWRSFNDEDRKRIAKALGRS